MTAEILHIRDWQSPEEREAKIRLMGLAAVDAELSIDQDPREFHVKLAEWQACHRPADGDVA